MTMHQWIALLSVTCLLTNFYCPVDAATPYRGKAHAAYRKVNKRTVPPKVQQHFSFIPPKQPSAVIQRLQAPLQGRVVQQETIPMPTTITPPVSTTIEQLPIPAPPEISAIKKMGFWKQVKNRMTFKASHSLSERITPQHSWIEHLPNSDTASMSELIAHWIQTQISRPQATLVLADPPQYQTKSNFIPNLAYALQKRGYAIAGKNAGVPDAYWVRYRIRAFDQGLLVQIKINGQETSRLYVRSQAGALVAVSPITNLKVGEHP